MLDDQIQVEKQTSMTEPQVTKSPTPVKQDDPFAAQREELRRQILQEAAQAYNPALQDAERRASEAQRRIQELESQRNQSTTKKDDPTQFLAAPQSEVRSIVREELAATAGPINQFMMQQQNQMLYQQIKAQFRVHPQLAVVLPQVEAYLDQQYMNLNPLNPGSAAGLMMTILGQIQAGFLMPLVNPNANNGGNGNGGITNKPLPNPSITPSPPVAPIKEKSNTIELTEQQRRVARLQGLTDEEYLAFANNTGAIADLRAIGAQKK